MTLAGLAVSFAWAAMPVTAPAPAMAGGPAQEVALRALFVAGLKGGLLTFGGAYAAIPYVRADTVGRGCPIRCCRHRSSWPR